VGSHGSTTGCVSDQGALPLPAAMSSGTSPDRRRHQTSRHRHKTTAQASRDRHRLMLIDLPLWPNATPTEPAATEAGVLLFIAPIRTRLWMSRATAEVYLPSWNGREFDLSRNGRRTQTLPELPRRHDQPLEPNQMDVGPGDLSALMKPTNVEVRGDISACELDFCGTWSFCF